MIKNVGSNKHWDFINALQQVAFVLERHNKEDSCKSEEMKIFHMKSERQVTTTINCVVCRKQLGSFGMDFCAPSFKVPDKKNFTA